MPAKLTRWQPARLRHASTKERAHYVCAEWRALRQRILIRDSFTCAKCGRVVYGQAAHVDHIVPLEAGGTDHPSNLQVLCDADHGRKTRGEQRQNGIGSGW